MKKLNLNRESLRVIAGTSLATIHGGVDPNLTTDLRCNVQTDDCDTRQSGTISTDTGCCATTSKTTKVY